MDITNLKFACLTERERKDLLADLHLLRINNPKINFDIVINDLEQIHSSLKFQKSKSITINGNKYWFNKKKQLHREDGPAIEYSDGTKKYYQNGVLHRKDGPAIERTNGIVEYFFNGHMHRLDGPAFDESCDKDDDKFMRWHIDGKLHREDGPALIGDRDNPNYHYQFGKKHRLDGPAVIWPSGDVEYWLFGEYIEDHGAYCKLVNEINNEL